MLLLTNTQVSKLRKAFANGSSANIKLLKTKLHKIRQSGGVLGKLLGPLLKTGLSLIDNVLKPRATSVFIPLGLIEAASATDTVIHKKIFGSGATILIISNEEMNNIMKIIKFLEKSGLLMKHVSETVKNEAKGRFLSMLLGTLGASLLGSLLIGKGTIRASESKTRAGHDFLCSLIL